MAYSFRLSALALAALTPLVSPAQAKALGGALFVERFNHVDEDRWAISDGWRNGAWTANDWRARQVSTRGDGLAIVLSRHDGRDDLFSSGEVQSTELYTHGYFETRMQAPRGSGLVSGFFTYGRPDARGHWDEIDIEILGRDTNQVQFTIFHAGASRAVTVPLGFDAAEGLHTYGFEWLPDRIRWYVDGRLLHEARGDDLPNAPQRLISHLWNSATLGEWVGPIDAAGASWTLRVACIAHAERYVGVSLCAPAPKTPILFASNEREKRA